MAGTIKTIHDYDEITNMDNLDELVVWVTAAGATRRISRASVFASTDAVTLGGNVAVGGTLGVTGAATLSSTLAVSGATTLSADTTINNATLYVKANEAGQGEVHIYADQGDDNADQWKLAASAAGAFAVQTNASGSWASVLDATAATKAVSFPGAVTVTGATTLSSTLTVAGATTFNGNVSFGVGDTLTVGTGATSLGGTLTVAGATTVAALTASGLITANGGVTLGAGDTLTVPGTSALAATTVSTLTASSNVSVGGTLGVTGATTVAALTASGLITANGGITLGGALTVTGATTLSSTLDVTGTTTLDGALHVNSGVIYVTSTVTNAGILIDAAAGLDPYVRFEEANTGKAMIGVDGSDSDKLKIGTGSLSTPSNFTTPAITIDTSNDVVIGSDLDVGGNTTLSGTLAANGDVTVATTKKITLAGTADIYTAQNTWTPAITGSTGNPTVSYDSRPAYYKQVGNAVFYTFAMQADCSGGTGHIRVSLPATPAYAGVASAYCTLPGGAIADYPGYVWRFEGSGTYATLYQQAGNPVNVNALGENTILMGSGHFFV